MSKKKITNWGRLIAWIVGVEMVGVVGSVFTVSAIDSWYQFLNKPAFNPPNWLFGPVWTVLYVMIGVVGYVLWQLKSKETVILRRWYVLQILLNGIWTPVFFGLKRTDLALVIILSLWATLVVVMVKMRGVHANLVWWLVPYWLWVSFASALNFSVWLLN